jgi:hypothetical protein
MEDSSLNKDISVRSQFGLMLQIGVRVCVHACACV